MELQEQIERTCATKVELMAFREETAINFGKVHEAIARGEGKIAEVETRIIKWFVATSVTLVGVVFALARYLP